MRQLLFTKNYNETIFFNFCYVGVFLDQLVVTSQNFQALLAGSGEFQTSYCARHGAVAHITRDKGVGVAF